MPIHDPILMKMAGELREALIAAGEDPSDPPDTPPPNERAFAEYQERGGVVYEDPAEFTKELVRAVAA